MTALGFAVRKIPNELPQIVLAALTGINSAAVGLIALAAYRLSLNTVTDRVTRLLLCLSAAMGLLYSSIWLLPTLMLGAGLVTLIFDEVTRKEGMGESSVASAAPDLAPLLVQSDSPSVLEEASPGSSSRLALHRAPGYGATTNGTASHTHLAHEPQLLEASVSVPTSISFLIFFACLFMSAVIFRAVVSNAPRIWDFGINIFIGGSIIFGGGAVVVPVLREYVVDPGWVSDRDFLFGFAILQAFPGPNFNFSAYLGVLANPDNPVLGALIGLVALYSPGLILEFALLPFYVKLRENRVTRSLLRGLNAAAVGLVFLAVVELWKIGARTGKGSTSLDSDTWWLIVVCMSFVSVQWYNNLPPVAIAMGGIAGLGWYAVNGET